MKFEFIKSVPNIFPISTFFTGGDTMTRKERAEKFCEILKELYPEAICSLNYSTPLELLIATQLSAQCTDARVNIVTETLFKKYLKKRKDRRQLVRRS